jgi:uncharacterized protein YeaO (DUF488 family)
MSIDVVRLGSRRRRTSLRLGTVRHPPRGVPKADYARRDFFDVWLPDLAPSAELLAWARRPQLTAAGWKSFERRYRREMQAPGPRRLISLLAALSARTDIDVGCYCENESRCHRSILRKLLVDAGAEIESSNFRI